MSKFAPRVAIVVVIMLTAGVAQAQRGNFSPEQMRQRFDEQNKELVTQLALTEEQTPKFMEIMNASYESRLKMMEEVRNSGGGFQGMREKFAALEEETTKNLAEVFTEDQLTKYKEILANRPRGGAGRVRPS